MKRGYTVAEVLIVIGLAMILAAILFPVFRRAVDRSKELSCASNLRALPVSLDMYRTEHDGHGKYGTPREMGMPPLPYLDIWDEVSCNGVSPMRMSDKPVYGSMWTGFDDQLWAAAVWKYKDATAALGDDNHGNTLEDIGNPYAVHRGIASCLDTHVKTIVKRGRMTLEWWNE